jgi:hypothetical protein
VAPGGVEPPHADSKSAALLSARSFHSWDCWHRTRRRLAHRSVLAGLLHRRLSCARRQNSTATPEVGVFRLLLVGLAVLGLLLGVFALAGDRLGLWQPIDAAPVSIEGGEKASDSDPTAAAEKHAVHFRENDETQSSPSPPLRARTAFFVAALAAAIGLLVPGMRKLAGVVSSLRWAELRPARYPASSQPTDAPRRFPRVHRREGKHSTLVVHGAAALRRAAPRIERRVVAFSRMQKRVLAPAIAVATRGRPSSFHFRINHETRENLTVYVLAVALGVAVGYLVAFGVR